MKNRFAVGLFLLMAACDINISGDLSKPKNDDEKAGSGGGGMDGGPAGNAGMGSGGKAGGGQAGMGGSGGAKVNQKEAFENFRLTSREHLAQKAMEDPDKFVTASVSLMKEEDLSNLLPLADQYGFKVSYAIIKVKGHAVGKFFDYNFPLTNELVRVQNSLKNDFELRLNEALASGAPVESTYAQEANDLLKAAIAWQIDYYGFNAVATLAQLEAMAKGDFNNRIRMIQVHGDMLWTIPTAFFDPQFATQKLVAKPLLILSLKAYAKYTKKQQG